MPSHVAQAQHLKAIDPSSGPKVISHGGSYRWRIHRGQGAHCNPFSDQKPEREEPLDAAIVGGFTRVKVRIAILLQTKTMEGRNLLRS